MKNNKGQALVTFLLVLPFLLMLCGFLFDVGLLNTEKRKMENVVKDSIQYGFSHQNENTKQNIEVLLKQNIEDVMINQINISESKIEIEITKKQKSFYSIMAGKNIYKIKAHYVGYLTESKITYGKE